MKDIKFYDIYDDMDFGKYKDTGKTIEEILEDDADYIRWCIENVDNVSFSDEVISILEREK